MHACGVFVVGAMTALLAARAFACGEQLPASSRTIEASGYVLAYATDPASVELGRHFTVDFIVCPRPGAASPQAVRVDANMPEHRHGMNYRPSVVQLPSGVYRATGMLLHMPGRWDLTFDIVAGNRTQRLLAPMRIE